MLRIVRGWGRTDESSSPPLHFSVLHFNIPVLLLEPTRPNIKHPLSPTLLFSVWSLWTSQRPLNDASPRSRRKGLFGHRQLIPSSVKQWKIGGTFLYVVAGLNLLENSP